MVEEGSRGVEGSEDHKRVRKEFVHLLRGTGKGAISRPWRGDLEETKYRQCVAARELQDNADNPNSSQKDVESVVRNAACTVAPYAQQRALNRRWIANPPRGSREKQHENRYPSRQMHEEASCSGRSSGQTVTEGSQCPR